MGQAMYVEAGSIWRNLCTSSQFCREPKSALKKKSELRKKKKSSKTKEGHGFSLESSLSLELFPKLNKMIVSKTMKKVLFTGKVETNPP